jgi:hypothetical protein
MKSQLKGRRFYDAPDMIKNVTVELKFISQNGYQEWFQHFCNRWQKCVVAQGYYFEGNAA